jgi:hypothetical protein
MSAMAMMYSAIAVDPYFGRSAVAMSGEKPPATAAVYCAPSDAPL